MKPRITLVTLGVDDLERAVAFYRDGLGWATEGIIGKEFENGAVAFFEPSTVCGGYAAYFQDPDGHLWEVAFNPAWRSQ